MPSVAPNMMMLRRAMNGPKAVYAIDKNPKLFLATNGKGGGSWRIRYRPHSGAQQVWLTISNDARNVAFDDVTKKARELLSNHDLNGVDPRDARPRRGEQFDDTFALWLEGHAKRRKKSWLADEKIYVRHIKSRLGAKLLRSIDRATIIGVLDDIAQKATPLQANRCQSVISAVFSWALDESKVTAHPALRIRRRGVERSRDLILSPPQLKEFWSKIDQVFPNAALAIKILLLTGQRRSEVVEAMRREFDLDREDPEWTIPGARTKNGLTHIVPLTPMVVALVRAAMSHTSDNPFLFPARRIEPAALDGSQVSRQCKGLFRVVGEPGMRLHDLRHQAATGMAQCGVPLDIRQMVQNQITGRQQSIGSIYDQHDYSDEKRRALLVWERALQQTLTGERSSRERY